MSEILDLPARHSRTSPVYVVGAGRSGTSLLCTLLRRYLKVSFGPESQFIVRYYRRLPVYGDLRQPPNLRRLVDDVAGERCFVRWRSRLGFTLDSHRVFADASQDPSYANVLRAAFGQCAAFLRMPRWGDKTPEYNADLPVLLNLFPNAQFIHIVRDGRDVALSTLRTSFGATNVYRAAVNWRQTVLQVQHFAASLPEGQLLTVRYESLLADPVGTLHDISRFLGIEEDAQLQASIAADVPTRVRSTNAGGWQARMRVKEQRLFEAVAGELLRLNGYPVWPEGTRPIGVVSRIWWETHHLVKKTLWPRYWSDSVYRAGVRARAARRALAAAAPGRATSDGHQTNAPQSGLSRSSR